MHSRYQSLDADNFLKLNEDKMEVSSFTHGNNAPNVMTT